MFRKLFQGAGIAIIACFIAILAHEKEWLSWPENKLWDLRERYFARPSSATDSIRLILIDQPSLDWAFNELNLRWPWPREAYEPILAFCKRCGAKAVTFDLLFTEASSYGVDDDEILGTAIKNSVPFAGVLWLSKTHGYTKTWREEVPYVLTRAITNDFIKKLRPEIVKNTTMDFASFPIPQVATNSLLLGTVNALPDDDAIVRKIPVFQIFDNHFVPVLGLALWMSANNDGIIFTDKSITIGGTKIELNKDGNVILRYRGKSQTHKAVSAAGVIQSEMRLREGGNPSVDPSFLRDKYVFLGVTAPGLMDLKPTPISKVYPGVEIHATFLDNLLIGDFAKEAKDIYVLLFIVICAIILGIWMRFCSGAGQTTAIFLLAVLIPLFAGFYAYEKKIWFNIMSPLSANVLSVLSVFILNYATEGRQKRFIKNAFKQYLSEEVIEKLIKDPGHLKLGGEVRELSIYFSDVQGFTGISESLGPEKLTFLLNEYLTAMSDIIMDQGGTIDKYEGDAIIAFWNAPLDLPDHAARSVRAALLCQKKLVEMKDYLKDIAGREVICRIGLNTGKVVIGNMGSHRRFNYTFLGDAGNLASRLEGVNKQFGTRIMVSQFTKDKITSNEFAFRELARVKVVGRKEPVTVYEPMFPETVNEKKEILVCFGQALQLFYDGKFKEAADLFAKIANDDPPAGAYLRKCEGLAKSPPPADIWNGVWEMTEK